MQAVEFAGVALLSILFVYASVLALRYRVRLDILQDDLNHSEAQYRMLHETFAREQGAFDAYRRQVEEEGAIDLEVQRLREANNRLALQLGTVYERIEGYRDGLLDAGHDSEAEAFQKWLDGGHDDELH